MKNQRKSKRFYIVPTTPKKFLITSELRVSFKPIRIAKRKEKRRN